MFRIRPDRSAQAALAERRHHVLGYLDRVSPENAVKLKSYFLAINGVLTVEKVGEKYVFSLSKPRSSVLNGSLPDYFLTIQEAGIPDPFQDLETV